MKKEIHPEYVDARIVCACGHVWETRSTRKDTKVGICAKCHPFFTGKQKFIDTEGRVEKFRQRYGVKKDKE
jgi:large subunit ribosomal protein L31